MRFRQLKRVKTLRKAKAAPRPLSASKSSEEKPQPTVRLSLDDLRQKAEDDVTQAALKLFSVDKFKADWKIHLEKLVPEMQATLTKMYAYQDAISMFESELAEHIDPTVEILDKPLQTEIEELLRFQLVLIFVRCVFNDADTEAIRGYLLQPETATRTSRLKSANPSDLIRQLYGQMFGSKDPVESADRPISEGVNPRGVAVSKSKSTRK